MFESEIETLANMVTRASEILRDSSTTAECRVGRAADIFSRWNGLTRPNASDVSHPARGGRRGLAGWQIRRVKELVQQGLSGSIHVSDMAAVARLSVSHFSRSFHISFNHSPHRYLERQRVERACELMRSTDTHLAQIAITCGFSDQSHFNKSFKKHRGCTPGHWRRHGGPLPLPARELAAPTGLRVHALAIKHTEITLRSALADRAD